MLPVALAGLGALALMSNPFRKAKRNPAKKKYRRGYSADDLVSRSITASEWAWVKSMRAGRAAKRAPAVQASNPKRFGQKLSKHKLSGAEWRIIQANRAKEKGMRARLAQYAKDRDAAKAAAPAPVHVPASAIEAQRMNETEPRANPFRRGKARKTTRPVGTIFKRKGKTYIVTRTRNGRPIARRWVNKGRRK
jgi:hypothetical protein